MGNESRVLSHESQVSSLLKKASTFGFASLLPWNCQVGGSCSVKGGHQAAHWGLHLWMGPMVLLVTLPL